MSKESTAHKQGKGKAMRMKQVAYNAVQSLAYDIAEGAELWPQVDRIERRFRLAGAALSIVGQIELDRRIDELERIKRIPWHERTEAENSALTADIGVLCR